MIIVIHWFIFEKKNNFDNERIKHDIQNSIFLPSYNQRSQVIINFNSYNRSYSALPINENNFKKI